MTDLDATTSSTDVALADRAARHLLAELAALSVGELDRSTPCADWDVRVLVAHVADVADVLTDLVTAGQLVMPGPPEPRPGDLRSRARERVQHLIALLRAAEARGSVTPEHGTAARAAALEFTAHGWDVAAACGRAGSLPGDLAGDVLAVAGELLDGAPRGVPFAHPVAPERGATPADRLAAFLGRDPARWRAPGAAG